MSAIAEAELTVEAAWLLDEARALAVSSRCDTFTTVHVLAVALRSDTTFGAALRRTALTDLSDEINEATACNGVQRIPVQQVCTDADVRALLRAASTRATHAGRVRADAEDVVWALTVVLGPHSRFFESAEPSVRATLDAAPDVATQGLLHRMRRTRPAEAAGCLWLLWTFLMKALSAGVTILIAGAGVILHHAAVELAALMFRFRARFTGWTEQIGGRLETNRALSRREAIASTLLVRAVLTAISIVIFAAVLLESRGVGLSPWPLLTRDPTMAFGPRNEADTNLLVMLFTGRRRMELWTALGLGFMAVPTFGEVDRARELLRVGSHRARAAAAALTPLRAVTRVFDRFDAVTTVLGFPAMLSSGMLGVVTCSVAGSYVADLAIRLLA